MRLVITTTYENVDQTWLDWWLKRLASEEVMPGSIAIVEMLRTNGSASFSSKDPSSEVTATTEYKIEAPVPHTEETK